MRCSKFKENIFLYIDNELTKAENEEFRHHAESCSDCLVYLKEMEETIKAVRRIEEVEPPQNMKDAVIIKINKTKEQNKIKNIRHIRKIAGIAAVFIIFLTMAVFFNYIYNGNILIRQDNNKNSAGDMSDIKAPGTDRTLDDSGTYSPPVRPENDKTKSSEGAIATNYPVGAPDDFISDDTEIRMLTLIYDDRYNTADEILKEADLKNIDYRQHKEGNMVRIEFTVKEKTGDYTLKEFLKYLDSNYNMAIKDEGDWNLDTNGLNVVVN